MSYITQAKFMNLNTQQKATSKQVSNCVSQLNTQAMVALKQQAYMRTNQDGNVDAEYITLVGADVAPIAAAFKEAKEKMDDIIAVMTGTITPEDIITKYNIDVSQVSAELL
jgi:hypothetical protein